jgi:hypothetical protein
MSTILESLLEKLAEAAAKGRATVGLLALLSRFLPIVTTALCTGRPCGGKE